MPRSVGRESSREVVEEDDAHAGGDVQRVLAAHHRNLDDHIGAIKNRYGHTAHLVPEDEGRLPRIADLMEGPAAVGELDRDDCTAVGLEPFDGLDRAQ